MSDDLFQARNANPFTLASKQLAAIAQETRLAAMTVLTASGPTTVTQLADLIGVPMVQMSHHLGVLSSAGLVESAKDGREVVYRVHPDVRVEPTELAYLGGWRLAGVDVMMIAPPTPEAAEVDAAPTPAPKRRRQRKGA